MPSRSNKIFSGRQPRHCIKVVQSFRDWIRLHIQGVANGLVKPKPVLVWSLKHWRISHLDSAVCPRTLHWNRSPRKLEDCYAFWLVKLPFILSKDNDDALFALRTCTPTSVTNMQAASHFKWYLYYQNKTNTHKWCIRISTFIHGRIHVTVMTSEFKDYINIW